ncbi:DUF6048 family protein [Persicobacter diffluens]
MSTLFLYLTKFIFCVSFLLLPFFAMAQELEEENEPAKPTFDRSLYIRDTVRTTPMVLIDIPILDRSDEFKTLSRKERRELEKAKKDSLPKKILPPLSNLEIAVNYSDPIEGFSSRNGLMAEAWAGLTLFEYFVAVAEFGSQDITFNGSAYKNVDNYQVTGQYYRFGGDLKIPVKQNSSLRIGGRIGNSTFSDSGTARITGEIFDDYEVDFARNNLSANWWEVDITSETAIWKNLLMGFTFRYRVLGDFDNNYEVPVRYISGYGFANGTSMGLDLFLAWRIPIMPVRYKERIPKN